MLGDDPMEHRAARISGLVVAFGDWAAARHRDRLMASAVPRGDEGKLIKRRARSSPWRPVSGRPPTGLPTARCVRACVRAVLGSSTSSWTIFPQRETVESTLHPLLYRDLAAALPPRRRGGRAHKEWMRERPARGKDRPFALRVRRAEEPLLHRGDARERRRSRDGRIEIPRARARKSSSAPRKSTCRSATPATWSGSRWPTDGHVPKPSRDLREARA